MELDDAAVEAGHGNIPVEIMNVRRSRSRDPMPYLVSSVFI
jgi:hypothetical protein